MALATSESRLHVAYILQHDSPQSLLQKEVVIYVFIDSCFRMQYVKNKLRGVIADNVELYFRTPGTDSWLLNKLNETIKAGLNSSSHSLLAMPKLGEESQHVFTHK